MNTKPLTEQRLMLAGKAASLTRSDPEPAKPGIMTLIRSVIWLIDYASTKEDTPILYLRKWLHALV